MVRQTLLQLTDRLVRALDQRAGQKGISRSALVREILEESLLSDREALIGAQIVDGYRRVPPAVPDEWGDVEGIGDLNTELRHIAHPKQQGVSRWNGYNVP